ncbi:MAG: SGNH/GDSL hydrolase family protein [Flavobacteriales bacterium]|nr:SGNH/GDSL hydrolase family protein [Flavobacteriales bacterium]
MSNKLKNILLILISFGTGLVLAEMIAQKIAPPIKENFVIQPSIDFRYIIDPKITPGIVGTSQFVSTSEGTRNFQLPSPNDRVVYAMGGSTTECLLLDQKETWSHLLMEKLSETKHVWIGNIGKSGSHTHHHILQLKNLLKQRSKIDEVIFMIGLNDLTFFLVDSSEYLDPEPLKTQLQAFNQNTKSDTSKWGLQRLYNQFKRKNKKPDVPIYHDKFNEFYPNLRRRRRNADKVDQLPNLDNALFVFQQNIDTLVKICTNIGIKPVFINQAYMWTDSINQYHKDLIWMGGNGKFMHQINDSYYSLAVLSEGMSAFNEALEAKTKDLSVAFIKIDHLLPKDTSVFYDDCHFNENGARLLSDILWSELK